MFQTMASRAKEVTKLIQDAILKICSQYVEFQKSLEIDGIICLSPGEFHPDIVVKMHRTVLQPKFKELASDWHADVSTVSPIESPDPPAPMTYNYELYNPHPRLHTSGSKSELPSQTFQDGGSQSSYTTEEGQVQSTNEIRNVKRKMIMDYNTPTPTPEKHAKMDHIEQITIEQDNYEDNEYTDDVNLDDSQSGIASNIGDIAREYQTADLESKEVRFGNISNPGEKHTLGTGKEAKIEEYAVEMDSNIYDMKHTSYSDSITPYRKDGSPQSHSDLTHNTIGNSTKSYTGATYQCELCHKIFNKSSVYKRHLKVHSGLKPYVCEICSKGFNRKDVLQRHIKLCHSTQISTNVPNIVPKIEIIEDHD
ncbi:unnamed protein product [Owenia fusiformis]|uniref:Uncharacterized protein n=1 Tax=Owenia fusiformis TaxID=6347 RepID=A0A8J1XM85_OWEFU|nr:unnamed protein product [Owenia fusiformis]